MENLYSHKYDLFLQKVREEAVSILTHEMKLQVFRSKVMFNTTLIPLQYVLFEHPSKLGFFHLQYYEIGVNKMYIHQSTEDLVNLLRHELAHFYTHLRYGPDISDHGPEFKQVCKQFGWANTISRAKIPFEALQQKAEIATKVEKLLALAKSSNAHEAALAAQKAQSLLAKHHLETPQPAHDDQEYAMRRIWTQKRSSSKLIAITEILRTFYVIPVINHTEQGCTLEIFGTKVNVEIAHHAFDFLNHEFEKRWKEAAHLKGTRAKNSFFTGIARGYINESTPTKALVLQHTKEALPLAYPRLRKHTSSTQIDSSAHQAGRREGKKVKVHAGIKTGGGPPLLN
ncbi:MAG: hypothetical protein S4CHLAM102_15980 [Chlamydiia bacterium]|nr:hypothetical protein [Chlamydiia bacterium]